MYHTKPLKKNRDFMRLYRKGSFYVGKYMVIYVMKNDSGSNNLGITTVRHFGNSVKRNRARRIVKENYRLMEKDIETGYDIIFNLRKKENDFPEFKDIRKEMKYLLRKTGLLIKRDNHG